MRSPLDFLEELQGKPEGTRRAFAVASVLVMMAVIVSLWFATFSISDSGNSVAAVAGSSEDQPSPFTLFWNYAKDTFSQVKDKVSEGKAVISEVQTEVSQLQDSLATTTDSVATSTDSVATSTNTTQ
ncbi:MAG: hypothetical protein Q7K44_02755 [Candidatus Liptonbacteria bacterium]|nr:hypothetical protein [Candidatus Liptonbacteria bacterium]